MNQSINKPNVFNTAAVLFIAYGIIIICFVSLRRNFKYINAR